MKRRCDKIFSVVNHNPCVGKLNAKHTIYGNKKKEGKKIQNSKTFHELKFSKSFMETKILCSVKC
jgi:hypothetical protein